MSSFLRIPFAWLFTLMLSLAVTSCQSAGQAVKWQGRVAYTRVGMHVEARKNGGLKMYSTNFIGLPVHIPVGTELTFRSVSGGKAELLMQDGQILEVQWTAKHDPGMTFSDWLDRQLSETPEALPADLSSKEVEAVRAGRYEVGLSRRALFRAVGYPPKSLSPVHDASTLIYQESRFDKIHFTFGPDDRLATVQD